MMFSCFFPCDVCSISCRWYLLSSAQVDNIQSQLLLMAVQKPHQSGSSQPVHETLIRRPGSARTVILILCRIRNMSAKTPPKIQNPKSKIQNLHKKNCYIRLQNPKSEIQNPKSEIQNPKSPAKIQNLGRWGPHKKNYYITIQNPKSPKSGRKSLDFGFWIEEFWILDSGFWVGPGDVPLGNSVTVP